MTEALQELSGAWNFRDVADGTAGLRPGRLFRSGELSRLDDDGRSTLRQLGVTDVADLRAAREVARRGPGLVPDGVDIHLLPMPDLGDQDVDDEPDGEPPHEAAFRKLFEGESGDAEQSGESPAEAAGRYMIDEYRQFPTRNGTQRALRQVVDLLGDGRAVLTHCFAGKDRTGFVIATVLEMIGFDRDAIIADYLRSNDSVSVLRERITESLSQRTDIEVTPEILKFTEARLSDEVLGVRPDYLAASWRAIDETYGSLDSYLRDADITASHIDQLRGALLS